MTSATEELQMPSRPGPEEVFLHVPVDEDLKEQVAAEAKADGIFLKDAVADALAMWLTYRQFRRRETGEGGSPQDQ